MLETDLAQSNGTLTTDEARLAYQQASRETGVPVEVLLSYDRAYDVVHARWRVMQIMKECGASLDSIARRTQVNRSTVVYGLRMLSRGRG